MSYGRKVHEHLERLDREGTAYTVKVYGFEYAVLEHSHEHLSLRPAGRRGPGAPTVFVNPALVNVISVEEK